MCAAVLIVMKAGKAFSMISICALILSGGWGRAALDSQNQQSYHYGADENRYKLTGKVVISERLKLGVDSEENQC
jgi:hypothetical protein